MFSYIEYKNKLKEENDHFEETMKDKSENIKKLEEELEFLKLDATMKLKKKM